MKLTGDSVEYRTSTDRDRRGGVMTTTIAPPSTDARYDHRHCG